MKLTLLLTALIGALACAYRARRKKTFLCANIAEGRHTTGNYQKLADAGLVGVGRYALAKVGSDSNHITVAGAVDSPQGIVTDEVTAAEDGVNVFDLACAQGTIFVINSGVTLVVGDLLVPAAAGRVAKLAAGAGNYYIVGRCLQDSSTAAELLECAPIGAWKTQ